MLGLSPSWTFGERLSVKLLGARIAGQNMSSTVENDPTAKEKDIDSKTSPKLVGEANEVSVKVDGIFTTALCDTGSCVSTCSEDFYKKNFKNKELKPLDTILDIECVDGSQLPYKGYIEADLETIGIEKSHKQLCLFLIVSDTDYNRSTPFLLGTNILNEFMSECKEQFGVKFLQKANIHTPWYMAFRCLTIRERELRKNNYKIATVRSAEQHKIQIGPNQSININCTTDNEINCQPTCSIITDTKNSSIPSFIDITPAIVHFDSSKKAGITVNLTNLTTNTVNISPRAIIAELQPVTIDQTTYEETVEENATNFFDEIHIGEGLAEDQETKLRDLLSQHADIFSTGDTDIGKCNLFKHRIELSNPTPFKQRHRRIPPGMVEEVRKHIEQLLSCGVIRKSKSPFASNIVLVRKKSGKLRMCVDYRMLNNRTIKDAYALPRVGCAMTDRV